jgi:hypothetical protein
LGNSLANAVQTTMIIINQPSSFSSFFFSLSLSIWQCEGGGRGDGGLVGAGRREIPPFLAGDQKKTKKTV